MKKLIHIAVIIGTTALLGSGTPASLQKAIDTLDADTVLRHGEWGLYVMDADSGTVIAEKNAQKFFTPASTLKLLTTGAALGLLGPDFRYETKVEYDGKMDRDNHVITGNVFIKGCGDPTLYSKYFIDKDSVKPFEVIARLLSVKGYKEIDGDLVADASCFTDNAAPDDWTWSDMGEYYGAGTSGLDYHDNMVRLLFNSMQDSCTIDSIYPKPKDVQYHSFVTADGVKDEAFVYGAPFGNLYYIYGNIPREKKNYKVDAADPDPAFECVNALADELKKAGITVKGKITTTRREQLNGKNYTAARTYLLSIHSHPMNEIVEATNINSDNVYAEQLLKTLGYLKGKGGTEEAGMDVIKNYWKSLGVDMDGLYMTDGCGLSRSNTITPFVQANILYAAKKQTWFNAFYKSLPVAGESGSMTNLCKGTSAEHNMHAKTGYINKARAYAGYVKTKGGKTVCFSLIANNYSCNAVEMKKRLEKILIAIADE